MDMKNVLMSETDLIKQDKLFANQQQRTKIDYQRIKYKEHAMKKKYQMIKRKREAIKKQIDGIRRRRRNHERAELRMKELKNELKKMFRSSMPSPSPQ